MALSAQTPREQLVMNSSAVTTHPSLQEQWISLYGLQLPALAKRRDPIQPHWPVVLDHCFARIILDNAVGIDRPWAEVVKAPAMKNMSAEQLRAAISLGQEILTGAKDLVELDERSLALRGKTSKVAKKRKAVAEVSADVGSVVKKKSRKGEMADIWASFKPADAMKEERTMATTPTTTTPVLEHDPTTSSSSSPESSSALATIRTRIATDLSLTPFRQRVLTLLTQVPRGRYTTYKALSEAISFTTPPTTITRTDKALSKPAKLTRVDAQIPAKTTCARAVGSAMRNNPFAPIVPCHRVLAADGKIGGFGGDWGDEGRFAAEKRRLLREEGVKFDGRGKVVGAVFVGFV